MPAVQLLMINIFSNVADISVHSVPSKVSNHNLEKKSTATRSYSRARQLALTPEPPLKLLALGWRRGGKGVMKRQARVTIP